MSTVVRVELDISAKRGELLTFGPWVFRQNEIYTEFFGAEFQIAATTLAQIIGGVSPSITAITDIQHLSLYPDQIIQVGLHGVDGQVRR
jgi:hypothetical protein